MRNETILIVDGGWYVDFATLLAREFNNVLYYSPWERDFPVAREAEIGYGLEGVERVHDLYDAIPEADLVIFPALHYPGMQRALRSAGKPVWGSGDGEQIELDRVFLKDWCEGEGFDTIPYKVVTGIEQLRDAMRAEEDFYIKSQKGYRGDTETYHHINWELSQQWLSDLTKRLGPAARFVQFLIEPPVEGFEGGFDTICIDGQMPSKFMVGYEIKDSCYVSHVQYIHRANPTFQRLVGQLGGYFAGVGFRNLISTEVRFTDEGRAYPIDIATRFPNPPYASELANLTNLGDVIVNGAQGIAIEPEFRYPYTVEINLVSSFVLRNWQPLQVDVVTRRHVFLHNAIYINGVYYVAPQLDQNDYGVVGTAVGFGNTLDDARDMAIANAEAVEGPTVWFNTADLEKAEKEIQKGEVHGVQF